jgi:hypothetical protein
VGSTEYLIVVNKISIFIMLSEGLHICKAGCHASQKQNTKRSEVESGKSDYKRTRHSAETFTCLWPRALISVDYISRAILMASHGGQQRDVAKCGSMLCEGCLPQDTAQFKTSSLTGIKYFVECFFRFVLFQTV